MKHLFVMILLSLSTTNARAQLCTDCGDENKAVGGGITITVRGEGPWVCSASGSRGYDALGRGMTRLEAETNAVALATALDGGSSFFVELKSCEQSSDSDPTISISESGKSLNIKSGSPKYICLAEDSIHDINVRGRADTLTEAKALSQYGCAKIAGSRFLCKTSCHDDEPAVDPGTQMIIDNMMRDLILN